MNEPDTGVINEVARILSKARSVLFITGAGLCEDSGMPTYRGIGGLCELSDNEDGYPIEVALSGQMLSLRPEITWKHLQRIEVACRRARANRGHDIIAALQDRIPRVWVLTQNLDGLHRAAGSRNIIEIHGNIHDLSCDGCGEWELVKDYSEIDIPPRCKRCGGAIRPAVVLFGDRLPMRAMDKIDHQMDDGFDIIISIGTSSVFPSVTAPTLDGCSQGIPTVEINTETSDISDSVDHHIRAGAADTLQALWQQLT